MADRGTDVEELRAPEGAPRVLDVGPPASTWRTYLRGMRVARRRRQGDLQGEAWPALSARQAGVRVEPRQASAYAGACGARYDGRALPPAFAEVLFHDLLAALFLHADFPLSPLGMIHVSQSLTVLRPLEPGMRLDLTASLGTARVSARGVRIRVPMEARLGGEVVWRGEGGFLSRSAETRDRKRAERPPMPAEGLPVEAPADTGRRYARASGDWNPHHLWGATARPLGYARPIAHGMWTLARCLELARASEKRQHGALSADVTFKRPLLLPGRAVLQLAPEGLGTRMGLRDPRTGAPHLDGVVHFGSPEAAAET